MALSTMRVGAAPRAAVARSQTVQVVARGSWRDSATVTAQPTASAPAANRVSPTRSVLPANWRQELESLRNGNGSSPAAAPAPTPAPAARSSSASWRTEAPAPAAAPARPSSSPKKAVTPNRSALPANWKQELEALRGSPSPAAAAAPAPAPARSSSASWRTEAPAPAAAPARPSSSPKKAVTPNRSALPANWKQELEALRGSPSPAAAAAPAPAPARSSSASWRTEAPAPAAAPARPSSSKKAATPTRSALPANWKQELDSLRGSAAPAAPAAPAPAAPARSSSASWRTESPAADSSKGADGKVGTNPWTGKSKVEIKRTALPADWRSGL